MIDIKNLDKAEVLAALYNASKPLGMGIYQYDPAPMTTEEARELMGARPDLTPSASASQRSYFDYLKGRVMKVDLSGDALDPRLYDRDNGEGAAAEAIAALRQKTVAA